MRSIKNNTVQFIMILMALLVTERATAQLQPVSVNVVMPYPHSIYLSDYFKPTATDLQVITTLNDFSGGNRDVKIKFTISNGTIELSTKPSYVNSNLITLTPGVPLTLQGSDLVDALNLSNLNMTGITTQQLQSTGGRLPEGNYQFCVEILDAQLGKPLSEQRCQNALLQEHQPPLITSPMCGERILPSAPQIVQLNWQLSAANPPSQAGFNSYTVEIYRITDETTQDPQNAVINSKAVKIYTSQPTVVTNFSLDYSSVLLVPGERYVFRIQATGPDNKQIFSNDGYSEWCWFSYGYPEGGIIELQEPFNDKQFEKGEQLIFSWNGSDKSVDGQQFEYKITMVEFDSDTQDVDQAILNNPTFFEKKMPLVSSNDGGNFLLNEPVEPNKSYAWKVVAYTGEQIVAASETFTFHTPPLLDAFYASNQKIKVLKIDNEDLNNFEGKARIQLSEDEEDYIDVPFANLKLKEVSGIHVLTEGEINFDLSEREEMEVPAEIEANGIGFLTYTSGKIDKDGLKVRGKLKWQFPHAVLDGEQEYVFSKESDFVMDNNNQLSGEAAIEPFQTIMMDPKDFKVKFDPTSKIQLAKNELTVSVKGEVTLPPSVINTKEEALIITIRDFQNQFDYIELSNMIGTINGGIAPIKGLKLEYIPLSNGTLDFSEDQSPGKLDQDASWKGFYVENFKLRLNTGGFDITNQVTIPSRLDSNQTLVDNADRFWISGTGLDLRTSFDFQNVEGLKFNSFQTSNFTGNFDIRKSEFKTVTIGGKMQIPFLDEEEDFEFIVPNSVEGLDEGYIDGLIDKQITYNPYGGENRMDFTINRAVFVDHQYLSVNTDISIPEIDVLIEGFEDFRLYGDYFVGAGGRNTAKELDEQRIGRFKQLDVTVTEIGAAFLGGRYAVSYKMEAFLSDGFTNAEGGAPTFTISSVAASSIEADPTSLVDPEIEVPDDLLGDDEVVKPTGFDLNIETPMLDANAYLLFTSDDPEWGTKFEAGANVSLKLPAPYNLGGNMAFGIVDGMDYWYFDAYFEDVNGPGIEVIAQIAQVQVKLTAIVGVEGQVFRHMKSLPTEDGKKVELKLSPETQFGAKMYMQLIEPYTKGFVYQADLGLEAEIVGEGSQVDEFTATLSGEASFLNLAIRTGGPKIDANTVLAAAESAGVADEIIDGIFPQSFDLAGENITVDSKGLSQESSIEIGNYDAGDGFLFAAKLANDPGGEIGLAIPNQFKIGGGGYANGNGFFDLNVDDVNINAKLEDKVKGNFKLDIDGLKTEFGGDYIKKKANFGFQYDDIQLGLNVDKLKKSGDVLLDIDDFHFEAMADIPAKSGAFDFKYQTKAFNTYFDGMELAAGLGLKYDDYAFDTKFNIQEKFGQLKLETPVFELYTKASNQEALLNLEAGSYLFNVNSDFVAKTGSAKLTFPNHEISGDISTTEGGVFVRSNDFEIGLNGKFDGTAGDLHLKEGDFLFDVGADLNKKSGYLDMQIDNLKFNNQLALNDTSFIRYNDGDNFYEGVAFKTDYVRTQFKLPDHHFLLELDKQKLAGQTKFMIPNFYANSQFDGSTDYAALQLGIYDHKINTAFKKDSLAINYLYQDYDLLVSGKSDGSGKVQLTDHQRNFGTGFTFDIKDKAGSIFFEKDDLHVELGGNYAQKSGWLGLTYQDYMFKGTLTDSLLLENRYKDYYFAAIKSKLRLSATFGYKNDKYVLSKYNDGVGLEYINPNQRFGIARRNDVNITTYQSDDLQTTTQVGIDITSAQLTIGDLHVNALVSESNQIDLTSKYDGKELTIAGDFDDDQFNFEEQIGAWDINATLDAKNQESELTLKKQAIEISGETGESSEFIGYTNEADKFFSYAGFDGATPILETYINGVEIEVEATKNHSGDAVSQIFLPNPFYDGNEEFDGKHIRIKGDNFEYRVMNVGDERNCMIDVQIGQTTFSFSKEDKRKCHYRIEGLSNNFFGKSKYHDEQTIDGKQVVIDIDDDGFNEVSLQDGNVKVYAIFTCETFPQIFVESEGKEYQVIPQENYFELTIGDNSIIQDYEANSSEIILGDDQIISVKERQVTSTVEEYAIFNGKNGLGITTGTTTINAQKEFVNVSTGEKKVQLNDNRSCLVQIDPNKYISAGSDFLETQADDKSLYISASEVRASDQSLNFNAELSSDRIYIAKDDYSVLASADLVECKAGSDFISISEEALGMKFQDKELDISADKKVHYKDNDRELVASQESLYLQYYEKVLEVNKDFVHIKADATKEFFVNKTGTIKAQYDDYKVELLDPLTNPSFAYSDTDNEVALSKQEAKISILGKGIVANSEKLRLFYDDNYVQFAKNDMQFKYDRYEAHFKEFTDMSLTNGVQAFSVKGTEIKAAIDEEHKISVNASKTTPELALQVKDNQFLISSEKAAIEYNGMHYGLGKKDYIVVHEVGKPEEGFLFNENGIEYSFASDKKIKVAPKGDLFHLTYDNVDVKFNDAYSISVGLDQYVTTLNKDLSASFTDGTSLIELNKPDFLVGYRYKPKDVFLKFKRFEDQHYGLMAGVDKYAGFIKTADDRSIEIGGEIENLGRTSVRVNKDKDIGINLMKDQGNKVQLAIEKAKKLDLFAIDLGGSSFFSYGEPVDVLGEGVSGIEAVSPDGPTHLSKISENAMGWGAAGVAFKATISKNPSMLATGRIQTGLTLPLMCGDIPFGAEIRPGRVRFKLADPSDMASMQLLCLGGLPPLVKESGWSDFIFETGSSSATISLGLGYKVEAELGGKADVSIGKFSGSLYARAYGSYGFGGQASLTIPLSDEEQVGLALESIYADIKLAAAIGGSVSWGPVSKSFDVSASIEGRMELEGDLEGAKASGQVKGSINVMGVKKSFDLEGTIEI